MQNHAFNGLIIALILWRSTVSFGQKEIVNFTLSPADELELQLDTTTLLTLPRLVFEMWQVDSPAGFPGGEQALMKYISENLQIPPWNRETDSIPPTKLKYSFIIEADGTITSVRMYTPRPTSAAMETAFLDLIRRMPRWRPAQKAGVPVAVQYFLPISCILWR